MEKLLESGRAEGVTSSGPGRGVPANGRLEGVAVPELLAALGRSSFSGALVLEKDDVRKVLYLREGSVVFAASTDREDRLGAFLIRRGEIDLPPLIDAGADVERGRRLGQILVERGIMEPAAVTRAVADQIRDIALSVFAWREGRFVTSSARLPMDETVTLDLPMDDLILAGVRRVRDWRRIRRSVGGPRAIYRSVSDWGERGVALAMTERAVLERAQTTVRVDDLTREVLAPAFAVYRALWALSILGLVERVDPSELSSELPGPGEGVIGSDGAVDALLDLGDREFTGVLRLFHDGEQGAIHLERGRVLFATTSDPELSLSGHLLRRGIVSEREHEKAERRLISGKRLGELLAEQGVLEASDVERFVREQVLDVARHLILWQGGEYVVEEALPSQETITLSLPVEDVVMAALESCDEFTRIWAGLGGLDQAFWLSSSYLDRLDRMALRPAAWELVSLIDEATTLRQILEGTQGSHFEVCRLVYALMRVRVLERVEPWEKGDQPPAVPPKSAEPVAPRASVSDPAERPRSAAQLAPELFGHSAAEDEGEEEGEGEKKLEKRDETKREAALEHATASDGDGEEATEEAAAERSEGDESAQIVAAAESLEGGGAARAAEEAFSIPDEEEISQAFAAAESEPEGGAAAASDAEAGAASPFELDEDAVTGAFGAPPPSPSAQPEDEDFVDEPISEEAAEEVQTEEPEVAAGDAEPAETPAAARKTLEMERPAELAEPVDAPDTRDDGDVPEALDAEPVAADADEKRDPADAARRAAVETFNERHARLFSHLRRHVGAGLVNFVRTCQRNLGGAAAVFEGLTPDREGRYDTDQLAERLAGEAWRDEPLVVLEALIDEELAMIRHLLDREAVRAIEDDLGA